MQRRQREQVAREREHPRRGVRCPAAAVCVASVRAGAERRLEVCLVAHEDEAVPASVDDDDVV